MVKKLDAAEISKAESINDVLFACFDPEEEMLWLVGGSETRTFTYSVSPAGHSDANVQFDWNTY